ncbi:MAG: DUF4287 domain-containing protein [Acidobacteria bacterium]|nr:DUF4287 domain-containing protein [Acidobacteriota bacterium]
MSGKKSLYSPHPAIAHEAAMIRNMPEKTGRTLQQWIAIARKAAPPGEKERRQWLNLETAVDGLPTISTPAAASICTESSSPQTGELRSS